MQNKLAVNAGVWNWKSLKTFFSCFFFFFSGCIARPAAAGRSSCNLLLARLVDFESSFKIKISSGYQVFISLPPLYLVKPFDMTISLTSLLFSLSALDLGFSIRHQQHRHHHCHRHHQHHYKQRPH